ncbi:tripartite motif-containing protein 16-like [Mugil cephalus]|uniref:tripartite motif-containing protein 16-like n=1 Tax=Mugil cephalus TaxID=48193 RepID=UPI001FB66E81|nr:tripartite motif-containing protein 16-like [Mugil cephalus]
MKRFGSAHFTKRDLISKVKGPFVLTFDQSLSQRNKTKQLDLHVRFWEGERVQSRYLGSQFMGQPKTRDEFRKYSCEITLDPNTANTDLLLSEGNRKVTVMNQHQSYSDHPDRFTDYWQVLSRESLTGRCYWEVEWRGRRGVGVAVASKNISRAGNECLFGFNDKSWSLRCYTNSYEFYHNKVQTPVSGPGSSRVGVYLDHRAGLLSFYSVSETMTLLHRVQTTFTQPLYAGLRFWFPDFGATAELMKVK